VELRPYYRTFDLPWDIDPEESERLRKFLTVALVAVLVAVVVIPFLPVPQRAAQEEVPQRLAKVMLDYKPPEPPPPPPKPKEEPKPEVKVAAIAPKPVDRTDEARKKAQKAVRQFQDELADLRQNLPEIPVEQTRNLTGAVGADSRAERALITSKVGAASGGIATTSSSRGFGAGAGSLEGHNTTRVGLPAGVPVGGRGEGATRSGNSGKASRSREEIELVFDRNKGAIYALYSRALREQPDLQGKMVLEFTIAPSGEVTMCRVVSSEIKDPELERKIVARVRLFRFEARDVEAITTTKPIDFFPA
jgi:TonB family protein